ISHLYLCPYLHMYFFFSSRRRHTRFSRDWSSDVCSSDLTNLIVSSTRRTVRNALSTDFLTVVCNSCRLANTLCRYRQWISRILQHVSKNQILNRIAVVVFSFINGSMRFNAQFISSLFNSLQLFVGESTRVYNNRMNF